MDWHSCLRTIDYNYSMELSEDQLIRLQICEKCYEHQQYDQHSEHLFQENFHALSSLASEIGLKTVRNQPPKYLRKAPNTKLSTKRYIDTNTGKIIQFPDKGCFEVYYKNILVYSKLQTATFPDLSYLCSILKTIKSLYLTNPSILGGMQKFRDLQYEWKRNEKLCQSLYHYIRMNACGNKSEEFIKDIILGLVNSNLEHSRTQKKIVYPYLLYDSKEKKHKLQSIYCPGGTSSFFTHRSSATSLGIGKKIVKQKKLRPQTGSNGKTNYLKVRNSVTQRQVGTIVKNTKNEIFQLVIKEENKKIDEEKIKKWMKSSNLTIQETKVASRQHSRQGSTSKQSKPKLWSLSKQKSNKNSKEVYVAYLNNLKEKKKMVNNKFQIKFKKGNQEQGMKTPKPAKSLDQSQKISSSLQGNLSSSRFGSIRKNKMSRDQLSPQEKDQTHRQSWQKKSDFQLTKEVGEGQRFARISEKVDKQNEQNSENAQQLLKQSDLIQPATTKISIKNSKILKQSKLSQVKNTEQLNEALSKTLIQNEAEKKDINDNNFGQIQQSKVEDEADQNVQSSRLKRVSIEQATVQKRISLRKRGSTHERYPHSISRLCQSRELLASPFMNEISGTSDRVIDNITLPKCQSDWEKFTQDYVYCREPAQIIKKIVQEQNFYTQSYSNKYAELILSPNSQEVEFKITGQELTSKFVVISMRSICKPSQIRLFPDIFKQIQCTTTTSGVQNTNIALNCHHKCKLMHVVNLMLRSNPMMISRIFQDKKSINPYGVYCIWLRSYSGRFQPVFVNDSFAFEQQQNQGKLKPVYSWLANENTIWYMLLEKAVAKVLGGYHMINQLSLAQLMSIIMSSPTVDIGHINPQKAIKVFDEKIFYNKMASIYTLRQHPQLKSQCKQEGRRVDRIVGFSYNKRDPKESAVTIKIEDSNSTIPMRQFLFTYGQIALLFFSNSYFLNQTPLKIQNNHHSVLSCRLTSEHSKNNCYLMFSCFPQKCSTKVTLYRQLSDEEAQINDGMNPLSQEDRRYEYIGEIYKTGNFFFQVQLNGGDYICLMENSYELAPFLSIFAEFPIKIGDITASEVSNNEKQISKNSKMKKSKRKQKGQKSQISKQDRQEAQTPKILIEHRIPVNKLKPQKSKNDKESQKKEQNSIKIRKKYAYQPDNLYDIDEIEQEKQNINKDERKSKSKDKKKVRLKQMKQNTIQNQIQKQNKENIEIQIPQTSMSKCNVNRIIDDYD